MTHDLSDLPPACTLVKTQDQSWHQSWHILASPQENASSLGVEFAELLADQGAQMQDQYRRMTLLALSKALAWQDKEGQVWLTYNDPSYIAGRHEIKNRSEIVKKMTGALNNLTNAATKK